MPGHTARAQEQASQEHSYKYKDKFERDTPRGSIQGFIAACRNHEFDKAARYLDLRSIDKKKRARVGVEYAEKLIFILDRTLDISFPSFSDDPTGVLEDGLPKSYESLGDINTENQKYSIQLQRVWSKGKQVWLFSGDTVKSIDDLYEYYGHGLVGELLPEVFVKFELMTIQLWQWIVMLLSIPMSLLFAEIISRKTISLLPRISRAIPDFPEKVQLQVLANPGRLFVAILLFMIISSALNLTISVRDFIDLLTQSLLLLSLNWLLAKIVDISMDLSESRLRKKGLTVASSMIPLGRKFAKVLLLVAMCLSLLQVYNVDITALLAGLGVGGIAVALAAQKSLENLFSGVALITDQPVRVGDLCKFDDRIGRVEDIGLRSTRIRTLDRSVITIPNREFSQMRLENLTLRDKMSFHTLIGLRYETSATQLRFILSELRKLFAAHPRILQDRMTRVRFISLGEYSLDIEVFCHIATARWYEYLAVKEDILLRVIELVEECGSGFAFPSRTVYQQPSSDLDQQKKSQSENQYESLKESGSLPFPDLSSSQLESLRGTLSYPPEGSINTLKKSKGT